MRTLRDRPALLGRIVGGGGGGCGLLAIAALFGSATPREFARHAAVLLPALCAFAVSIYAIGGRAGPAIAKGLVARAAAIGAGAAIACLLSGAGVLGCASFLVYGTAAHPFGWGQAVYDYLGKPILAIALYGALPAALIGVICGVVLHRLLRPAGPAPLP